MKKMVAQKPITTVPGAAVVATAAIVPIATVAMVVIWGRNGLEVGLLAVVFVLVATAAAALLSYMLAAHQFPPRIGRGEVELPEADVQDTATSLDFLTDTIEEIVDRLERLEAALRYEPPQAG